MFVDFFNTASHVFAELYKVSQNMNLTDGERSCDKTDL